MRTMNWMLTVSVLSLAVRAGAGPAERDGSWGAGVQAYTIGLGNLDVYEWGVGVEAQARFWTGPAFGWAAALGLARWETDSGSYQWGAPVRGSLLLAPVGGSLLWRSCAVSPSRFVAEAGLRFVFADSDVELLVAGRDPQPVSIDNGFLALVGLDYERDLGRAIFFAGATYQIQVADVDARWADGKLRSNDLEAMSLRIGFRRPF